MVARRPLRMALRRCRLMVRRLLRLMQPIRHRPTGRRHLRLRIQGVGRHRCRLGRVIQTTSGTEVPPPVGCEFGAWAFSR